jgi:hypothetical protein
MHEPAWIFWASLTHFSLQWELFLESVGVTKADVPGLIAQAEDLMR